MKDCKCSPIMMTAKVLVLAAAINTGLAALGYNVLGMLVPSMPMVITALSLAMGLAGLYLLVMMCKECKK